MPTNKGLKTIYDPSIWPDTRLKQALAESVDDVMSNGKVAGSDGFFLGNTKENFPIRFKIENNKIATFFFD